MGELQDPKDVGDSSLREAKESSLQRDRERGWDHENQTHNGVDVSWALMDEPPKSKELIYVKKPDHSFVFSPRPKTDLNQRGGTTLPHSMLAGGGKVIGAGECVSDADGKIAHADNFSGHYQPKEENLQQTKKNMEEKGLAADKARFEVKNAAGDVVKVL
jgi:hypothetical protein